jgi:hypothetical protein
MKVIPEAYLMKVIPEAYLMKVIQDEQNQPRSLCLMEENLSFNDNYII